MSQGLLHDIAHAQISSCPRGAAVPGGNRRSGPHRCEHGDRLVTGSVAGARGPGLAPMVSTVSWAARLLAKAHFHFSSNFQNAQI
jgi:hypothetical protein